MIIPLTKLKYDLNQAIDYYNTLVSDHEDLHWYYTRDHNDPSVIDPKNNLGKMNGWGLQTIYNDLKFPYHGDIDPHDEGPEYFKDTELVFGWGKEIIENFEQHYRSFLLVWPPGECLGKWTRTADPHFRMYIPILSNNQAYMISHTDPVTKVLLMPGTVYLNTMNTHTELRNDGNTDLVFLQVNSPNKFLEKTLNKFR
jgi:hypothetical protein